MPQLRATQATCGMPGVQEAPQAHSMIGRVARSTGLFGSYFLLCYLVLRAGPASHSLFPFGPGVNLLLFLLGCYGVSNIAVESGATYPFRELAGKLPLVGRELYHEDGTQSPDWGVLACIMCTAMWVGTLLAAAGAGVFPVPASLGAGALALLLHGAMGSGFAYFVHVLVRWLGG